MNGIILLVGVLLFAILIMLLLTKQWGGLILFFLQAQPIPQVVQGLRKEVRTPSLFNSTHLQEK